MSKRFLLANLGLFLLITTTTDALAADKPHPYPEQIQKAEPALYWSMDQRDDNQIPSEGSVDGFVAELVSGADLTAGPRTPAYPDFSSNNQGIRFQNSRQYLKIKERKGESPLKFRNGDAMTIEAWVKPDGDIGRSYPYIVGKGRLRNAGFHANNQNYSLRLDTRSGSAHLSFLFFDEGVLKGQGTEQSGHRWTSKSSVPKDGEWHHVAFSYKFGDPISIQGYIDGRPTSGTWDLAGETTAPPIVDDDDVWIGSSMGGSNGFKGALDEIAIHRRILKPEELENRYRHNAIDYLQRLVDQTVENAPEDHVVCSIHEGVGASRNWKVRPQDDPFTWQREAFAVTRLPRKYNKRGIIEDRRGPLLIHLHSRLTLPEGEHELIMRSLNSARLYIDGKLVEETPFMGLNGSAHGEMHQLIPPKHGEVDCPVAHEERRIPYESDGKPHVFSLMMIAGHGNRPNRVGELTLAVGTPDSGYALLGPERTWNFDDPGWIAYTEHEFQEWRKTNARLRDEASRQEQEYWKSRHEQVRQWVDARERPEIPALTDQDVEHPIDRFVLSALRKEELEPSPEIDDWTFLRRLSLDLIGTNPTQEQIRAFFADPPEQRREYAVERFLNHPDWADHWVGYWQDVLAENPGLTKPMLNNTGPFRWYLHEAFSDNRSFDRIVTELTLMEGSRWGGGTAGFGVASNNDVPMAAKAHILGTAFLGVEMKCARCHDAPFHESLQRDLFAMAALLENRAVKVPKSSSINVSPEELASMIVKVTLKPGEQVEPQWPFEELITPQELTGQFINPETNNNRALLASLITHPQNDRFARVTVNRVWQRLLGRGIVEPAEDWESGSPSHPELLTWLSREFVRNGYDLKELTRLIVTSRLYQREVLSGESERQRHFAGPTRKKLTSEQIVDTVFQSVGKDLPSERLTYNADGRQAVANFVDFGKPRRAWELLAISNERERPSMALPQAQSLVNLMSAYNWRSQRQDPVTERDATATPLQPLALANGNALNTAVDLSENGDLVDLCVEAESAEQVVNQLYRRVLTREPTSREKQVLLSLLEPGFDDRLTGVTEVPEPEVFRSPLTWTAHFDPDASREGIRQQEEFEKGDEPTKRLKQDWRERVEDATWALFNSPEFVFVP